LPSHLAYLPNFNLVEERQGDGCRLFPHTQQLPEIFKAIQKEFLAGISARMANTDQRADDFRKFALSWVVNQFCLNFNSIGEDTLLVFPYYSRDGVAGLSVAQHVQKSEAGGINHSFRFFAGKDFLPPIFLSGKNIVFASHVFDRFQERVTNGTGRNIGELFWLLFSSFAIIVLSPNGHGEAAVTSHPFLFFPYQESASEYIFKTCLTVNELQDLSPVEPPRRLYFHYGEAFTAPASRIASVGGVRWMSQYFIDLWKKEETPKYESPLTNAERIKGYRRAVKAKLWNRLAKETEKGIIKEWPSNGKWEFTEGIYGPSMVHHGDQPRRFEKENL
jgi:hypothetical protein